MNLGFYANPYADRRAGIDRHAAGWIDALARRADDDLRVRLLAYGADTDPGRLPAPPGDRFTWHPCRVPRRLMRSAWTRLRWPPVETVLGRDLDVFHHVNYHLLPARSARRTCTVHDLAFTVDPSWFGRKLTRHFERECRRTLSGADHVFAVSEHTARHVREWCAEKDITPPPLTVARNGFTPICEESAERNLPNNPFAGRPYVVFVGTVDPRKNLERLVEAFDAAADRLPDHHLLIVGAPGRAWPEVRARVRRTGRSQLLGRLPDEMTGWLLRRADAIVYPSLHEGFGLPILDGFHYGVPVVTSDRGAIPEIAGDAALQVDPLDTAALADAIARAVRDDSLRNDLIERGRARLPRFTWDAAADAALTAWRALA